jgi:hypothetical protein
MSLHTLLYLRTNGKAKKSLYSPYSSFGIPSPVRMVVQQKEASHAL